MTQGLRATVYVFSQEDSENLPELQDREGKLNQCLSRNYGLQEQFGFIGVPGGTLTRFENHEKDLLLLLYNHGSRNAKGHLSSIFVFHSIPSEDRLHQGFTEGDLKAILEESGCTLVATERY